MPTDDSTGSAESNATTTSRRDLLKKTAVGAAAAGIVWSAPKIEGLSLRPEYAAAASGDTANLAVTWNANTAFNGSLHAATTALGGGTISVRGIWKRNVGNGDHKLTVPSISAGFAHGFDGVNNSLGFNYTGNGVPTITAINTNTPTKVTPPAVGTGALDLTYVGNVNANDAHPVNGVVGPVNLTFSFLCT
ncbi:MAG: twin-arginine translocation signal domain-containing protein [Actinomycetota bacterium]